MLILLINLLVSSCLGVLVSLYFYTELRKSGKLAIMPSKVSKTIYIVLGVLSALACYLLFDIAVAIGTLIKYGWTW